MSQKLTRRQLLKLFALAGGTSVIACMKLNTSLKTLAQEIQKEVYLPFITANSEPTATQPPTATNTATNTPTETATETATSEPSDTPTPPPSSGTFIDGPGGNVDTATDTLMSSSWPTHNGGTHANFQLEGPPGATQNALLRFNLSAIPGNYICVSAKLYLYRSYNPEGNEIHTGNVYSVSGANSSWIEGVGDIDLALRGEPCWDALEANGAGGVQTSWAGSPGCSTRGVDYETNSLGTWSFSTGSPIGTEIEIDLDTNRIQGWFGSNNTNFGIILISNNNHGVHVGSAENGTSGYRPKLVVEYAAPS